MPRLLRTDDIRRYLQDKKGEIKERTRRWSMCSDSSDCSVKSNSSLRSLPQYSSYRAFSSQGSFNKMSGLPTKTKTTKVVPRGQAQGAGSKEEISNGRSSGIPTPGAVSRENSFTKSHLPVFKRETSTPNLKRESSIPQIKREDSSPQIRSGSQKYAQKTPSRPSSAQPTLKKETPGLIKREGSLSQIKKTTTPAVRPRGAATAAAKSTPPGGKQGEILKVGDRVNISGSTKNGVIQFVGETRFAKGDWAGVVLDEAVGKNDGTVAGVRYFQCQPNYGVFVKVEKLLKLADISDPGYKPHDSQTPDKNSQLKTPAATPKITPVRTAENTEIPDNLAVGNRVSIGDTKVGYIRYLGETGFAKGIWCGVELQEPLGKNDGAVAGTRYFQCEQKYGLFAPVHKVKKIDDGEANLIASKDEIQTEQTALPKQSEAEKVEDKKDDSVMESELESQDSSITLVSSSMQLQLQDRDNEMKKLLKDRELDRAESQKLLEQYQQSENKLTSLRISFDKLQRENEDEVKRLQSLLSNSDKVKVSCEAQLEEERKKLEDLQFQLEEQMVTKELSSEADKENTRILEEKLSLKDVAVEQLEKQLEIAKHTEDDLKNRCSDLEFQLAETNEREIQSSQSLAVLQDKLKTLEDVLNEAQSESSEQSTHLIEELAKRDSEIEHFKEELKTKDNTLTDLDFQIKKYRDELNDTIEAKGALNKDIFDLKSQVQEKENEGTVLKSNLEKIKSENNDVKLRLKNAETKVEDLSTEKLKLEEEVSQLTQSSGDSSAQITYVNEQLQQTKRECTALKDEKSALTIKVETLTQNIEEIKETSSKEKAVLEKEIDEQQKRLQETISSLNETVEKQKQKQTELEKELENNSEGQKEQDEKCRNIEKILKEKEDELEAKRAEIVNLLDNAKQSESMQLELQNQIQKLKTESEEKSNELENLTKSKIDEDKDRASLQSSHENQLKEFNNLQQEHNSLKEKYQEIVHEKDVLSKEVNDVKQICEKKEADINDLELEKRKIEDKNNAVDLKYSEIVENNNELKNQLLFAQDENMILKERLNQMETDLSQGSDVTGKLQHELSLMKEEVSSCKTTISDLENTKTKLEERCECINAEKVKAYMESNKLLSLKSTLEEEIKSLKNEVQESMQREVNTRTSLEDDRIKLQDSVESTLSQLQQKEGELSSWRVKAQQLEKKVTEQEQLIQTLQANTVNGTVETSDNVTNENDLVINKLKEELENKTNEVMFLNTVVVDVQNKFKAAEEKIRLLEEGEGLFAESEGLDDTISPVRSGIKQRVFCDICDEFDLHETEDCPTQSSVEDIGTQYHAARGEERPYCTICEVFGHKTEDCDDEETF